MGLGRELPIPGANPLEKQRLRLIALQGAELDHDLRTDPQRNLAGREDAESRRLRDQVPDDRGRVGELLQVVEDQQRREPAEPVRQHHLERFIGATGRPDRLGDHRQDRPRLGDAGQAHQNTPPGKSSSMPAATAVAGPSCRCRRCRSA
jgi:hypothetical protein